MNPMFDRVVIVGAGLLGASVGLALQATDGARHIVGVGRRQTSLDKALASGAIHETSLDLADAVATADLVVIATPANAVVPTLHTLRTVCPATAIVIDVASTKSTICAHADAHWTTPRRFIGCHPMAGSEQSGPEHASATLYQGTVCLVEESPNLDHEALAMVTKFWQRLGARVVSVPADAHDAILARTSHVPHIASTLLATLAHEKDASVAFVGNGFRDTTRVAAGSPEMWRDITMTNRDAIVDGLESLQRHIGHFLTALEDADEDRLYELFENGRVAREKVLAE